MASAVSVTEEESVERNSSASKLAMSPVVVNVLICGPSLPPFTDLEVPFRLLTDGLAERLLAFPLITKRG